jgi:hypothetical protein
VTKPLYGKAIRYGINSFLHQHFKMGLSIIPPSLKLGNASTDDSSASHFTDSDLGISIWLPQKAKQNQFPVSLQNTNGHFSEKPYQLLFIRLVKITNGRFSAICCFTL